MDTVQTNGTAVMPRRTVNGRGIARRRLDARQKACLAADVISGRVQLQLSNKQVIELFNANTSYVDVARRLSVSKRSAIIQNEDDTSFTGLLNRRRPQSTLPASHTGNGTVTDADSVKPAKVVGAVGADMLAAVVTAEAH